MCVCVCVCVCVCAFVCVCVSVHVFSCVCVYYAQVAQSLASTPCTRSLTVFGRVPTRGCVIFSFIIFFFTLVFLLDEHWDSAQSGVLKVFVINM